MSNWKAHLCFLKSNIFGQTPTYEGCQDSLFVMLWEILSSGSSWAVEQESTRIFYPDALWIISPQQEAHLFRQDKGCLMHKF